MGSVSVRAFPPHSRTLRNTKGMLPHLSEHDRAGQRTILADAAHGPHSRTHTAAPSWADNALRSRKHQETAPRVNIQLCVFRRRGSTFALLGENANPLLNTRFTVFLKTRAQLAFVLARLETTSWGQSDGSHKLRQRGQLVRESG